MTLCRPALAPRSPRRRRTVCSPGDLVEFAKANVPAAVLIAITDRAEPGVILTVRREHMRTHAGQVAFPGGRVDRRRRCRRRRAPRSA